MASSSTSRALAVAKANPQRLDTNVARSLAAVRSTRAATTQVLKTLSKAGLLNDITVDETNESNIKRQIGEAAASHANAGTPYGPVVQSMEIGVEGCEHLEYVNPFAFLYYLSSISAAFSEMMRSVYVPGRPLRLIIYADGLEPGNPFRHERARHLRII